MELWDAYYEDGTLAGLDLVRGEKIPEGLRHAVAEIFVVHKDKSILLMQRDFGKPNYPGLWENGASGSVILQSLYHIVSETTIYWGYLCVTDIPKEKVRLQEGETIAFKWVHEREFKEIFYSNQYVNTVRERLKDFVEKGSYLCGI